MTKCSAWNLDYDDSIMFFSFTSRCSFIAIRFYTVLHHPFSGSTVFFTCSIFVISKEKTKASLLWSQQRSFTAPTEEERRAGCSRVPSDKHGVENENESRGKVTKRKEGRKEWAVCSLPFKTRQWSERFKFSSKNAVHLCLWRVFLFLRLKKQQHLKRKHKQQEAQLKYCSH